MRIKEKTYICVLLAVCILLLGADAGAFRIEKSILSANSDYFGPVLDKSDGILKDAGVCTTKMLNGGGDAGSTHFLANQSQLRKAIRTVQEILYCDYMTPEVGKFFTKEELAEVKCRYPEEYLTLFIHRSDGKKRFYAFF